MSFIHNSKRANTTKKDKSVSLCFELQCHTECLQFNFCSRSLHPLSQCDPSRISWAASKMLQDRKAGRPTQPMSTQTHSYKEFECSALVFFFTVAVKLWCSAGRPAGAYYGLADSYRKWLYFVSAQMFSLWLYCFFVKISIWSKSVWSGAGISEERCSSWG